MPRGPFVPIPNTAKVEYLGHSASRSTPVNVVTHVLVPSAPTAAQLSAILTAMATRLASEFPGISGDWNVDALRATDLNSSTGPQVVHPVGSGGSGTPLDCSIAAVTELHTASRGRSYTGRHFLPWNAGDAVADLMELSPGGATNVGLFWTRTQADLVALSPSSGFVVASRKLHISTPVTAFVPRTNLGRIRRREFG